MPVLNIDWIAVHDVNRGIVYIRPEKVEMAREPRDGELGKCIISLASQTISVTEKLRDVLFLMGYTVTDDGLPA